MGPERPCGFAPSDPAAPGPLGPVSGIGPGRGPPQAWLPDGGLGAGLGAPATRGRAACEAGAQEPGTSVRWPVPASSRRPRAQAGDTLPGFSSEPRAGPTAHRPFGSLCGEHIPTHSGRRARTPESKSVPGISSSKESFILKDFIWCPRQKQYYSRMALRKRMSLFKIQLFESRDRLFIVLRYF